MKNDDHTAQIITGQRREIAVNPEDLDVLKAKVDNKIASLAGNHLDTADSDVVPMQLPRRSQTLGRNLARIAACAAALGVAIWATASIVHQPSSWADGVRIEPAKAAQYVSQCIRNAVEGNDLSEFSLDETDGSILIWNNPVSGQVERLDFTQATMQFAEQRGKATGLWFSIGDSLVGACQVEDNEAVSALSPLSSQTEQPGIYSSFFSTFTLRDGSKGNVFGDILRFEQTSSEFVRYEAAFADGTQVTGTVQNGYFIVMKRVDYPQFDPEVPVGNGDAVLESLTLYRSDGSGAKTTQLDNGPVVEELP